MKQNNIIQEKSYAFAVRIVNLYKLLCEEEKEYVLSKQLLHLGSSIGVCLMKDTEYISLIQKNSLISDLEELLRIIGSIQKLVRNS